MAKKTWNKKELKEFKHIIEDKRQTVLENIEEARGRADDIINQGNQSSIYSSHMADAGSDQQSLEHAYSIINRESSFLNYLDLLRAHQNIYLFLKTTGIIFSFRQQPLTSSLCHQLPVR